VFGDSLVFAWCWLLDVQRLFGGWLVVAGLFFGG